MGRSWRLQEGAALDAETTLSVDLIRRVAQVQNLDEATELSVRGVQPPLRSCDPILLDVRQGI